MDGLARDYGIYLQMPCCEYQGRVPRTIRNILAIWIEISVGYNRNLDPGR